MAGIRFDLSSPETIERFRQFVIETLGSAGELTPELQKKLVEKAQEIDVHKVDYEQAIWEVSGQIIRNKNQCPICGKGFHAAILSFCEQCGWDLKNDLILGKNQKPFCLSDVNDYKKRIETAKRQWKEKLATIKQQKEIEDEKKRIQASRIVMPSLHFRRKEIEDEKKRIQADKEALIRQKELEEAFLEKCKKSKDPIDCYNEYLLKYPEGVYKPHAKRAINEIEDKSRLAEIEEGRNKLDEIKRQKELANEVTMLQAEIIIQAQPVLDKKQVNGEKHEWNQNDICKRCGLSKGALEYFGWSKYCEKASQGTPSVVKDNKAGFIWRYALSNIPMLGVIIPIIPLLLYVIYPFFFSYNKPILSVIMLINMGFIISWSGEMSLHDLYESWFEGKEHYRWYDYLGATALFLLSILFWFGLALFVVLVVCTVVVWVNNALMSLVKNDILRFYITTFPLGFFSGIYFLYSNKD